MNHQDNFPKYIDGRRILKVWQRNDPRERILLYARKNGTFGFDFEQYSNLEFEKCWMEMSGGSMFEALEIAEREIKGNYPWATEERLVDF